MQTLNIPQIIRKTRDRQPLSKEEVNYLVSSVVDGTAQPSQIGAWLMAVYLNDITPEETTNLTLAMRDSGHQLKWPNELPVGDKHSTGGIGDKVSIILAPALAACGVYVPMISARGLGHTGGTVDKLESIPGFTCALPVEEIVSAVKTHGLVITCQSKEVVPADAVLYRTRSVTETVPSVPLITASILSKKLSAGLKALVMDVKYGRAAFMTDYERARKVAHSIQTVATACGVKTATCITRMDVPIGKYVGNSLEVFECIVGLKTGEIQHDLEELVVEEGACLLRSLEFSASLDDGRQKIREVIRNGKAFDKFCKMCELHHVKQDTIDKIAQINRFEDLYTQDVFKLAAHRTLIPAIRAGYVADINALTVGYVAFELGSGRTNSEASIDEAVGLVIFKHVGDAVKAGEAWCEMHHQDLSDEKRDAFIKRLQDSVVIQDEAPILEKFVTEILS